jgi:hypothetical protein
MSFIASEHKTHGHRGGMGLAREKCGGIGPIKALIALIKENHLFRLAFGMEIGDNFNGTARLHQSDFHIERAEIDAQNGARIYSLNETEK